MTSDMWCKREKQHAHPSFCLYLYVLVQGLPGPWYCRAACRAVSLGLAEVAGHGLMRCTPKLFAEPLAWQVIAGASVSRPEVRFLPLLLHFPFPFKYTCRKGEASLSLDYDE